MPVAAMLAGAVHEPFDLALGEVASFNCQVYDGWRAFLGCRFHADKPCLRATYCLADTLSCTVSLLWWRSARTDQHGGHGCAARLLFGARLDARARCGPR